MRAKNLLLLGFVIALAVALSLVGSAVRARPEEQATQFDVHVGDAFIEGLTATGNLGDVAQASNGDTIKVIFTGHFDVKDHEAEGNGTFEHFNSSGTLLEFGTFQAHHLISFTDFGTTPPPPTFHGGTALIQVRGVRYDNSDPNLTTTSKFKATLRVDCVGFGNPPAGLGEGINFAVSGGPNFDTKPSNHGNTLFVATED